MRIVVPVGDEREPATSRRFADLPPKITYLTMGPPRAKIQGLKGIS
jgi:hypothetical protein